MIMRFKIIAGVASSLFFTALFTPVHAQSILPDSTLNTTVLSPNQRDFMIINGKAVGGNLFHSFREFSIPTGGSASFDLSNNSNISRIFSRVTGSNISNIDGLIQTLNHTNPVDVFLLNPNGILFGANARLNISGSFIATTANTIKFADGSIFSSSTPPLLTLSVPVGLQFGQDSGSIQVQGTGNDGVVPTNNLGLLTSPTRSLLLVGGDVSLSGGVITSPAGRIELGSVGSGEVQLNPTLTGWQLNYDAVQDFREVRLANHSILWNPFIITNLFGGIQIVGKHVSLDRAQIIASTVGNANSADLQILAQETLTLGGYDPTAIVPISLIMNQVGQNSTGKGGNIDVRSRAIQLIEGANIQTVGLGQGDAGSIKITASSIFAQGSVNVPIYLSPNQSSSSRIGTYISSSGTGGNVTISANELLLEDGGTIFSTVAPEVSGRGGNLSVTATDRLAIARLSTINSDASGIITSTNGNGNAGSITLTAGTIDLMDGGAIGSFTHRIRGIPGSGFGNAGNVQVSTDDSIKIAGFTREQTSFLGSLTTGSGNSGNVEVNARNVSVQSGGVLASGSTAIVGIYGDPTQSNDLGNSGSLKLTVAENLEVSGISQFTNTGSSVGTYTLGSGDSGDTDIRTRNLIVREGGTVASATAASGNAGQLKIQAQEIQINGDANYATGISASAAMPDLLTRIAYGIPDFPTGNTGKVVIDADRIQISDSGVISVFHQGTGNAGQLEITANSLRLDRNSALITTTLTGSGGNLNLNIQDLLIARNGSLISSQSFGTGDGGNINLNAKLIFSLENSDIIANAITGNGGNININTQSIFGAKFRSNLTAESDITASSKKGVNGNVQINNFAIAPDTVLLDLPSNLMNVNQQVSDQCSAIQQNRFVLTGRGGTPMNPSEQVTRNPTWSDLRSPTNTSSAPLASTQPMLVEATQLRRNADGKFELVAKGTSSAAQAANCALNQSSH
jgi:filamentous hemagglutinin family protein